MPSQEIVFKWCKRDKVGFWLTLQPNGIRCNYVTEEMVYRDERFQSGRHLFLGDAVKVDIPGYRQIQSGDEGKLAQWQGNLAKILDVGDATPYGRGAWIKDVNGVHEASGAIVFVAEDQNDPLKACCEQFEKLHGGDEIIRREIMMKDHLEGRAKDACSAVTESPVVSLNDVLGALSNSNGVERDCRVSDEKQKSEFDVEVSRYRLGRKG